MLMLKSALPRGKAARIRNTLLFGIDGRLAKTSMELELVGREAVLCTCFVDVLTDNFKAGVIPLG